MSIEKVLVVDDEEILRNFIAETLSRLHLDVYKAENGLKALNILKENSFDLIITDLKMPGMTGLELLKEIKKISPNTFVVIVTAFGSVENAVEAMRLGAFNYIIKPFSAETIETVIEKIKEHQILLEENNYFRRQYSRENQNGDRTFIAESQVMKQILEDIKKIAKSNANVMIMGESGTGKEVIASEIHYQSLRASRPFIKVNCAAIPETLIESEFFGHERGAFTGAHAKKLGRFELANQGTLLLDEITEVPILLQSKLLRAIQEQEFERVGGTKPIKVDVRIISTTNRNVSEAIKDKILREDLFYRLNVVPIHIPPLKERKEDIMPLATHFIQKFSAESHLAAKKFSEEAKKKLLEYNWPGNVRELANIIERAVVMEQSDVIQPESIYLGFPSYATGGMYGSNETITLKELEKKLIIETLEKQNFNRTKTAELLDISVRTLRNKLKEYNLED